MRLHQFLIVLFVRHHLDLYCLIDFYRRINSFGIIYKIIKDLNRTAFLGSILYENGLFSYIIFSYRFFPNTCHLFFIPIFNELHNKNTITKAFMYFVIFM